MGTGANALLLTPRGRLDAETCADLRLQLGAAFAIGVRAVVVDLRDVVSVDPVGLGVLTGAARHLRKKGGALVCTHAAPAVVTTLRIHELTELLEIPAAPPVRGLRGGGAPTGSPSASTSRAVRRGRPRALSAVVDPEWDPRPGTDPGVVAGGLG